MWVLKSVSTMYKKFFGLRLNPFDLTPDPTRFVSTKRHNEALAALYYGIRWHKGFVVVTGEVGTGKTLLLRCLLKLLKDSSDVAYAYLFNSRMSANEFLQYILSDFGLPASGKNKSELLLELGRFVLAREAKRLTTVLIIDEAHHLSGELLEEVRLLSNLETTDDKLLQIVLVGQPELDEKLDSPELRQLKQRIALRAQLGPLELEETREYIAKRLKIAGIEDGLQVIFPREAIAAVYRYSKGLPRLVNTICENGLIAAYAKQSSVVTPDMIEDVARQFRLGASVQVNGDGTEESRKAEGRRAGSARLDIFSDPRRSLSDEPKMSATVVAESSGDESYF
jgi:general secretion pathway protein A